MAYKVGIVCCSNGQHISYANDIKQLEHKLQKMGVEASFSDFIYEKTKFFSGSGSERAKALMNFYEDEKINAIYDISGGDIANEILPYLDYDIISKSDKMFWGYSDLTTIINAIYAKTGKKSVLYQVKNLVWDTSGNQERLFDEYINNNSSELFSFDYRFIQGNTLNGVVVGGNIRCLLKLSGTDFFPDMQDKVLLLEALGGNIPQFVTYLSQLKQMGVFEKIRGIILGTFSEMEREDIKPDVVELLLPYIPKDMPVVKTEYIGHGFNSRAIVIGQEINLR